MMGTDRQRVADCSVVACLPFPGLSCTAHSLSCSLCHSEILWRCAEAKQRNGGSLGHECSTTFTKQQIVSMPQIIANWVLSCFVLHVEPEYTRLWQLLSMLIDSFRDGTPRNLLDWVITHWLTGNWLFIWTLAASAFTVDTFYHDFAC